jgi:transcription antitermination factor NusA-like protein
MNVYIIAPVGFGAFAVGGFFVWWLINNPDKVERIASLVIRLLSQIPIARQHLLYARLGTSLQTTINLASQSINTEAFRILPHTMKIEWAKTGQDAQTFLRDGQVIVRIHPNVDDDHNIVVSTLAYLKKGLIPQARHYVDSTLMQATDFAVAKDIFKAAKRDSASEFLIQNVLLPEANKNPQLADDSTVLDLISNTGFLSPIFLVQLHSLGRRLFPSTPNTRLQHEIRNFLEFLRVIASKKTDEDVNLDFVHSNIRAKVLLVAREEKRLSGTNPFTRSIKHAQSGGLDYVYIAAWGKENVKFADTIAQSQQQAGCLKILSRYVYQRALSVADKTSICIVCALNITQGGLDILGLRGTLYSLLEEHVDELRDGKIEITALAREPGILSKIVVKSSVPGLDPIPCFVKKLGKGSLQLVLGTEKLQVIPWFDTTEGLLSNALLPTETDCISSVLLDDKTKTAIFKVQPHRFAKAIGRNGLNARLTSELTGWNIKIKRSEKD